jgi:hypothetical protein
MDGREQSLIITVIQIAYPAIQVPLLLVIIPVNVQTVTLRTDGWGQSSTIVVIQNALRAIQAIHHLVIILGNALTAIIPMDGRERYSITAA